MMPTAINTALARLACCESFFKCDETLPGDGSGAMVCSITGATYNPAIGLDEPQALSQWIENYAGPRSMGIRPYSGNAVPLAAGNMPNFGRRSVITFACGNLRGLNGSGVRVPFGNGQGADPPGRNGLISVSFEAGMHIRMRDANGVVVNPANEPARALPAVGTDIGIITEYAPATTDGVTITPGSVVARAVDFDCNTFGSGATETRQTAEVSTVFDLNPRLNNKTRFGGLAFYSILAFSFDAGLPDSEAARNEVYKWMMRQHSAGNRVLPPHWRYAASSRP